MPAGQAKKSPPPPPLAQGLDTPLNAEFGHFTSLLGTNGGKPFAREFFSTPLLNMWFSLMVKTLYLQGAELLIVSGNLEARMQVLYNQKWQNLHLLLQDDEYFMASQKPPCFLTNPVTRYTGSVYREYVSEKIYGSLCERVTVVSKKKADDVILRRSLQNIEIATSNHTPRGTTRDFEKHHELYPSKQHCPERSTAES